MCKRENKPHVHAELIKAWADGAIIQYLHGGNLGWVDVNDNRPNWIPDMKYRIKPELSDLEKYGVEKGDVWFNKDNLHCFIEKVRGKEEVEALYLYNKRSNCLYPVKDICIELRFRRGVVDKL